MQNLHREEGGGNPLRARYGHPSPGRKKIGIETRRIARIGSRTHEFGRELRLSWNTNTSIKLAAI